MCQSLRKNFPWINSQQLNEEVIIPIFQLETKTWKGMYLLEVTQLVGGRTRI